MKKAPLIIGFTGKAMAGKDTAASIIMSCCNMRGVVTCRLAFADPIRRIANAFRFPDSTLCDPTLKNSYKHDLFGITPRAFMQKVGSDMFRDNLDKDCWVKLLEAELISINDHYSDDLQHSCDVSIPTQQQLDLDGDAGVWNPTAVVVVTDVRFPNEVDMLKRHGGIIVRIERTNFTACEEWRSHESEQHIDDIKPDAIWYNNDSTAIAWMGSALKNFGDMIKERNIILDD